jgi:hypothetical protein
MLDFGQSGADLGDHVITVDAGREHPILRAKIPIDHAPKSTRTSVREDDIAESRLSRVPLQRVAVIDSAAMAMCFRTFAPSPHSQRLGDVAT